MKITPEAEIICWQLKEHMLPGTSHYNVVASTVDKLCREYDSLLNFVTDKMPTKEIEAELERLGIDTEKPYRKLLQKIRRKQKKGGE